VYLQMLYDDANYITVVVTDIFSLTAYCATGMPHNYLKHQSQQHHHAQQHITTSMWGSPTLSMTKFTASFSACIPPASSLIGRSCGYCDGLYGVLGLEGWLVGGSPSVQFLYLGGGYPSGPTDDPCKYLKHTSCTW